MSHATVAGVVALVLDLSLDYGSEQARKDNGSKWWDKFVVYGKDVRNEEFYRLPGNLNRCFPSFWCFHVCEELEMDLFPIFVITKLYYFLITSFFMIATLTIDGVLLHYMIDWWSIYIMNKTSWCLFFLNELVDVERRRILSLYYCRVNNLNRCK